MTILVTGDSGFMGSHVALQVDGRTGSSQGRQSRLVRHRSYADYARRPLGLEAHADRQNHSGFSEWQDAGLCRDRLEFRWCRGMRRRPSACRREGKGWRAVSFGRRESHAKAVARYAFPYYLTDGAEAENSP